MANFFFNEISFAENIRNNNVLHSNVVELTNFHSAVSNAKHIPFLHREALYACQIFGLNFQQAITKHCTKNIVSKVKRLIDRSSPALPEDGVLDDAATIFWSKNDISKTALGECAARIHIAEGNNICYSVISSTFTFSHIEVEIKETDTINIKVPNLHGMQKLAKHLENEFVAFTKWEDIFTKAQLFLKNICFEDYVLEELQSQPFLKNVADDIYTKLTELNEISKAHQGDFHELYQKYCTGKKAHFSGSSDDEKRDFEEELSFMVDGKKTLCPFHGKVKNQQYRIHMVGTPQPETIARIVYIGPKLTRR